MFRDKLNDAGLTPRLEVVEDTEQRTLMATDDGEGDESALAPGSDEWFNALRQVQEEERRLAVAVFDCGAGPRGQAEVLRDILADLLAEAG